MGIESRSTLQDCWRGGGGVVVGGEGERGAGEGGGGRLIWKRQVTG